MVMTEIGAGLSSLKAAKDIVQALSGMHTAAQINDVKLTLQGLILDAQQDLFDAHEAKSLTAKRIEELEREISRLKDWTAERSRYELVEVDRGSFAYMPKGGVESGEIAHWLCTNCFEAGRKSLMQNKGGVSDTVQYGCDCCKASFRVRNRIRPAYTNTAP